MQIEILARIKLTVSDERHRLLLDGDESEYETLSEDIKTKLDAHDVMIEDVEEA